MKILPLVIIFVLLAGSSYAVYIGNEQELGSDITLTQVEYHPFPVKPGDTFDISFTVKNTNLRRIVNDLRFSIQENYPFSLAKGEYQIKVIDSLGPGEKAFVSFRVKVDDNAVTGENDFSLIYQEGPEGSRRISQPLIIGIESTTQTLSVTEIKTNPDVLQPGSEALLFLTIKNTGGFLMRDIDVNLDLSSAELPLVPIGSSTTQRIPYINSGGSSELTFKVLVNSNAESKAYKIPLKINFADEIGQTYDIEDLIGLQVSANPDYLISLEESTVLIKNTASDLLISISNIGPSELKFLTIKLENSEDYEIIGSSIKYLGNLESDDFETVTFKIVPKSNFPEASLTLGFKDSFNKKYVEKELLTLKVYGQNEAVKLGLKENGKKFSYLFYVIIVILVYITFRNYRKTRDLTEALKLTLKKVILFIGTIIKLIIKPKFLRRNIQRFVKFLKE